MRDKKCIIKIQKRKYSKLLKGQTRLKKILGDNEQIKIIWPQIIVFDGNLIVSLVQNMVIANIFLMSQCVRYIWSLL